jgi:hypothetical protein
MGAYGVLEFVAKSLSQLVKTLGQLAERPVLEYNSFILKHNCYKCVVATGKQGYPTLVSPLEKPVLHYV